MMAISNAEWDVMRVVWAQEHTTSNDILAILNQNTEWSASTVKTLLKRLVTKHYLSTDKVGKGFIYTANVTEEEAINDQVDDLFSKFCQTKHHNIFYHLIEDSVMTLEDIASLERLLEQKKASAVAEVTCNCIPGQCRCKEHLEMENADGK